LPIFMSRLSLILVSTLAHLAVAVGLFVSGVWRIERLHAMPQRHAIEVPLAIPAPSAAGPVAAITDPIRRKIRKRVIKEAVQPVPARIEAAAPDPGPADATGAGIGSGDASDTGACQEGCGPSLAADPVCGNGAREDGEACDDGNLANGDGCASSCRLEIVPKPTSQVSPSVLRGLRIAGETQLHPSTTTQSQMVRDGARKAVGVLQVCVASDGRVDSAATRVSTGYEAYDAALAAAVRAWRYRPYTVDGVPVRACSTVSFVYTIR
jgi:TonB family protein